MSGSAHVVELAVTSTLKVDVLWGVSVRVRPWVLVLGLLVQLGVDVALSRRRSRVQIPYRPRS